MKINNHGQAIEIMNNAIPYAKQIKDIDLQHKDCIYFNWRSSRYKLDLDYSSVMAVDGCLLMGNDASILMSELIRREAVRLYIESETYSTNKP